MIGGGQKPKPGEVSLAHNGVLFLDELPEFKKHVLEGLRQPLEDMKVTISRAAQAITYPSRLMLVAAMNPCPCGYLTDNKIQCRCTHHQIHRYRSKISGPLLDRIDLHVDVPAVSYKDLTRGSSGENSADIRKRVNAARALQMHRYHRAKIYSNAQMNSRQLKRYCLLDKGTRRLLESVIDKFGLSARAYSRILKIARTIADLANQEAITVEHVSEAVQYRSLERNRKLV